MIIAERKPLSEVLGMLEGSSEILVLGCRSCTAICLVGGEREARAMCEALSLRSEIRGGGWKVEALTVERACEKEFLTPLAGFKGTVVSMACGVGAQVVQELLPEARVVPGVNTSNMGAPEGRGAFVERCVGCGDCVLHLTAGICPLARCAKNLLNGPCGGSRNGRCEVSPETPCAWDQIIKALERQGRDDLLRTNVPPKDWRPSRHGGPRRTIDPESYPGQVERLWRGEA